MKTSSIDEVQISLSKIWSCLRNMGVVSTVLALCICSGSVTAQTNPNPEVKACSTETCPGYCEQLTLPKTSVGQCVAQCKQSCIPPAPPPVTITPKYIVMAIAYAPPGCTVTTPTGCGTSNGSSYVDYGSSSSNGTKVSTKDSFQLGTTISYDADFLDVLSGGGSASFQNTTTDTSSVNITKTQTTDWKVPGNGDGIDHGQDQFFLLLHPKVTLSKSGSSAIQWGFNDPGAPYTVYAYELQNPAKARPSTTQVLQEVGLTTTDYQNILNEDPFGGTVATAGGRLHLASIESVHATTFTLGGAAATPAPGAGLDPKRFWYTGLSFPYEPAGTQSSCNSGGVCNCDAYSGSMSNDNAGDKGTEDDSQTTVDLEGGISVPKVYSLKLDTKMVWTESATTDNTTDNKQSASATVTCPSTSYKGPFGIQAWWDSRYGSFLLIPYDPGAVAMIHKGKVMSASNLPVQGQLVTLTYNGKTQRTYTAHDGSYGFPSWSGAPAFNGTGQVKTGTVMQPVNVGKALTPLVLKMK